MSVTFASMVPPIAPFLPGCPNLVIENTVRRKARELCHWAAVWRAEADPVTLVAGQTNYPVIPQVAYADIVSLLSGSTTIDGTKRPIKPMAYGYAQMLYPHWPEDYEGEQPQFFVLREPRELWLLPTPSVVGTALIYVQLAPKVNGTEWEEPLYARYEQALLHGTLAELLAIPERGWTDRKLAETHRREWTHQKAMARADAAGDFGERGLSVQMTPFA